MSNDLCFRVEKLDTVVHKLKVSMVESVKWKGTRHEVDALACCGSLLYLAGVISHWRQSSHVLGV